MRKSNRSIHASIALAAAITVGVTAPAWANVYATNLSQSSNSLDWGAAQTVTLSYLLNENADNGVTVEILNSSNAVVRTINIAGSVPKGVNNVVWDGKDDSAVGVPTDNYSFRVKPSDDGYGAWTEISIDSTLNNFFGPRGVDVNKNASSQYYGRVYVSEGRGATTGAGRVTVDGLYLLNADLSDAGGSKTGGVTWNGGTENSSPWRVVVGPDDRVYLSDWSDSHSGLWVGDADFNVAGEALDNTGRDSAGLNATHGSVAGMHIEGTGASRTIYTIDEDFTGGGAANTTGSVWRYDIGNAATFSGAPSAKVYDDAANGNKIANFYDDIVRAPDGTFWVSQDRSAGTDIPSLMQISSDGSTILWESLASLGSPDPLRNTRGIAFDPVHDWLALATYNGGKILIFDDDTKTILYTIVNSGSINRDVAFDAVGNLYVVNSSNERMKVFSPPDGANMSPTDSLAPVGAIYVTPEPATMVLLGVPVLALVRRRRA